MEQDLKHIIKIEMEKEESAFQKKLWEELYNSIDYPFYYNFKNDKNNYLEKLKRVFSDYCNYLYSVIIKEDSYSVYPVNLGNLIDGYFNSLIKSIIERHQTTYESLSFIYQELYNEYYDKVNTIKKELNEKKLMNYYGTPSYMHGRIECIHSCFERLKESNNVPDYSKVFYDAFTKFNNFFQNYLLGDEQKEEYAFYKNSFYYDYDELVEGYLKIVALEKENSYLVAEEWQYFLTNPNNHNNDHFAYLIHSSSHLPTNNNYQKDYICTTLVTEKELAIPYGKFGLIYPFEEEKIKAVGADDLGSFKMNKEEFINNGFIMNRQYKNSLFDNYFLENSKNSLLISPEDIENNLIEKNETKNDKPLNYQKYCIYSEIFLDNGVLPIGVFYTDDAKETEINNAKNWAELHNVPLIHLSLLALKKNRLAK